MRKIILTAAALVTIVFSIALFAQTFWGGKTMSAEKVKAKWGEEKFDGKKFRAGSASEKAKMAFSIMTDKTFIGQTYSQIRDTFGPYDGFYFIDTYPAYIIQEGEKPGQETWQLVFKIGKGYKVREIIMHKNCCEK